MKKKKIRRKSIHAIVVPFDSGFDTDDDPSSDEAIYKTLEMNPSAFCLAENHKIPVKGRSHGISKIKEDTIIKAIYTGLSRDRAANLAGVSKLLMDQWRRKGAKNLREHKYDDKYAQFFMKLRRASAHAELSHSKIIDKVAKGGRPILEVTKMVRIDKETGKEVLISQKSVKKLTEPNYKASLAMLAQRYPSRWGKTTKYSESGTTITDPLEMAKAIRDEVLRLDSLVPSEPNNKERREKQKEQRKAKEGN